MGMSVTLWQVDEGSGPAWKEPPGKPAEFSGDEFDENGRFTLEADFADVEGLLAKGLDVAGLPHGVDAENVQATWERFRLFVIDAARSGNALAFEFDD
jgi:hypothetical protein